jgi:hypothetical protein
LERTRLELDDFFAEVGDGVAKLDDSFAEVGDGVPKLGCRVAKLGCRVAKLGCRVAKLGCRVAKLGSRVFSLGSRVATLGECLAYVEIHVANRGDAFLERAVRVAKARASGRASPFRPNLAAERYSKVACARGIE